MKYLFFTIISMLFCFHKANVVASRASKWEDSSTYSIYGYFITKNRKPGCWFLVMILNCFQKNVRCKPLNSLFKSWLINSNNFLSLAAKYQGQRLIQWVAELQCRLNSQLHQISQVKVINKNLLQYFTCFVVSFQSMMYISYFYHSSIQTNHIHLPSSRL